MKIMGELGSKVSWMKYKEVITRAEKAEAENERLKSIISECTKALEEEYENHCERCILVCDQNIDCSIKFKSLLKKLFKIKAGGEV